MAVSFSCPQCTRRLRVGDVPPGTYIQCPQCQAVFPIPDSVPGSGSGTVREVPPAAADPVTDTVDEGHVGLEGLLCPNCNATLPREAVLCVACGLDLRTGEKLRTERKRRKGRRLERVWDGDMALTTRIIIAAVAGGLLLFVGMALMAAQEFVGAMAVIVFGGATVALGLGTFTRTHLTRSSQDQPVIRLTHHLCFIPYDRKALNPRKFDRLKIEHTGESGDSMAITMVLLICLCGVVPALIYLFAFSGRYQVALIAEGLDPITLYRGWSQPRMREVADSIEEATGLHCD